jgi:transposase
VIDYRNASLLSRFTRTGPGRTRSWDVTSRSGHNLCRQPLDHQTLGRPTALWAVAPAWPLARPLTRAWRCRAVELTDPARSRTRCYPRCSSRLVEHPASRAYDQSRHTRPGDYAAGLVAQKKSLRASERDEAAREAFREQLKTRPATDFVIIDECGSNLNLTPRYARAPRKERACGSVPRNTPPTTTLIASLTLQGMGAALVLPGATDHLAFEAYIEQVLAPTLRAGQVVVIDNLSAHKSARVQDSISACGCELWFLPSYSPDLSPIEQAFAKLKNAWRQAAARTADTLVDTICTSLPTITPSDAASFFRDCGYQSQAPLAQSL